MRATKPDLNYLAPGESHVAASTALVCLSFPRMLTLLSCPEYILSKSCSPKSDIYSAALLLFAAFNRGQPLTESHGR